MQRLEMGRAQSAIGHKAQEIKNESADKWRINIEYRTRNMNYEGLLVTDY